MAEYRTPPGIEHRAAREDLERRKERLLEQILLHGSIALIDDYVVRNDYNEALDKRRLETMESHNELANRLFDKTKPYSSGGDTLSASQPNQIVQQPTLNEVVLIEPRKQYNYQSVPYTKQVGARGWLKRTFGKRETVTKYEKLLVGERQLKHWELVSGGTDEEAFALKYCLRTPELRKFHVVRGARQLDYKFGAELVLPQSIAEQAIQIIRESPEFIREIILKFVKAEYDKKELANWREKYKILEPGETISSWPFISWLRYIHGQDPKTGNVTGEPAPTRMYITDDVNEEFDERNVVTVANK